MSLEALDELAQYTRKGSSKPDSLSFIYYLFWEKGIDLTRFNDLPIPYILDILSTHAYIKEQEEKASKKTQQKKDNTI